MVRKTVDWPSYIFLIIYVIFFFLILAHIFVSKAGVCLAPIFIINSHKFKMYYKCRVY